MGDVDGDGDLDFVVAAQQGNFLSTYINTDGEGLFTPVPSDTAIIGQGPRSMRMAFLDPDLKADVMVTLQIDNKLAVAPSTGVAPYFTTFTKYDTQLNAIGMEYIDLDGDAKGDIIVANRDSNSVSVFQGGSSPSFNFKGNVSVSSNTVWPWAVTALDWDNDGDREIFTACVASSTIVLNENMGNFTFGTGTSFAGSSSPFGITSAKIDADNFEDLAFTNSGGSVTLYTGTGTGTLNFWQSLGTGPTGATPSSVIVQDLNDDGFVDIATANDGGNSVAIMLWDQPNGVFMNAVDYHSGKGPKQLVAGDVDADGLPDIVTANDGSHSASLFLNKGDGTLYADRELSSVGQAGPPTGDAPWDVSIGAIDTTPGPEILSTNFQTPDGSVYLNDGFGNFTEPSATGGFPTQLQAAVGAKVQVVDDVDNDGIADFITGGTNSGVGTVKLNMGTGAIVNINPSPSYDISDVILARINNDNLKDLLILDRGKPVIPNQVIGHLYLCTGNGTPTVFDPPVAVALPALITQSGPSGLWTGDLNNDQRDDVAVSYQLASGVYPFGTLAILRNNNGTLVPGPAPTVYPIGITPCGNGMPACAEGAHVFAADIDNDGDRDIAVSDGVQAEVSVFRNNGSAVFSGPTILRERHLQSGKLFMADVNADDYNDIICVNNTDDNLSVFFSNGDGTWKDPQAPGVDGAPVGVWMYDKESDGDPDIITADSIIDKISIVNNLSVYPKAIITGPGPGAAASPNPSLVRHWRVDGTQITNLQFLAYIANPSYGVNVGSANIDGDPTKLDKILTGPGPGPLYDSEVKTFNPDGTPFLVDYIAYGTLKYGVNAHGAELDLDAPREVVTGPGPGPVYAPHVKGFQYNGTATMQPIGKINFFAYGTLQYGVGVAAGDFDKDNYDEILTGAGPGPVFGPHVRGWNFDNNVLSAVQKVSFFAYSTLKWGVNVRSIDFDGDKYTEFVTGPGPGSSSLRCCADSTTTGLNVTSVNKINANVFPQWKYGLNVEGADLENDGFDEIITGEGDDPIGDCQVQVFNYDNDRLLPITLLNFNAYTGLKYGVNVSFANLGRYAY
ncbi:MAG: VCBS repeat-containing protein [Acidobacteriota bacterium]